MPPTHRLRTAITNTATGAPAAATPANVLPTVLRLKWVAGRSENETRTPFAVLRPVSFRFIVQEDDDLAVAHRHRSTALVLADEEARRRSGYADLGI